MGRKTLLARRLYTRYKFMLQCCTKCWDPEWDPAYEKERMVQASEESVSMIARENEEESLTLDTDGATCAVDSDMNDTTEELRHRLEQAERRVDEAEKRAAESEKERASTIALLNEAEAKLAEADEQALTEAKEQAQALEEAEARVMAAEARADEAVESLLADDGDVKAQLSEWKARALAAEMRAEEAVDSLLGESAEELDTKLKQAEDQALTLAQDTNTPTKSFDELNKQVVMASLRRQGDSKTPDKIKFAEGDMLEHIEEIESRETLRQQEQEEIESLWDEYTTENEHRSSENDGSSIRTDLGMVSAPWDDDEIDDSEL